MSPTTLRVLSGPRQGQNLPLEKDSHLIGRGADRDIALSDYGDVSRHHVRLSQHSGEWIIEDLGSTNGVPVNGQSAQRTILQLPCRLQLGDFIAIGQGGQLGTRTASGTRQSSRQQ